MLILQAERDALLKPLLAVTGIVERRHTLPILSNVLIEKKADAVSFLATDLEIQITTASPDDIAGEAFRLTTSAKKLQDILRAIPDKTTVTLEQQDGRLMLKAGKSRFNLQTLPADDFPLLSAASAAEASFSLAQRDLKRLIAQVPANLAKSEVILPRKTIVELYKLLQDSDEQINVELLSNQVRFSFGSTVIISKIVDGKFPDYNRVIPLDNNNPGTMSILCTNSEQEEAEEELEIAYQGAELEIGFNINYLLDVLTNLPAETVQLAFGDAVRAVLVTIPDNATFKYVVMPMRI